MGQRLAAPARIERRMARPFLQVAGAMAGQQGRAEQRGLARAARATSASSASQARAARTAGHSSSARPTATLKGKGASWPASAWPSTRRANGASASSCGDTMA
ncbi:hypothetical protein [Bordetella pertussis]|uniref:hypothetical protein n=1 Tax=Bordetella pertussis TaxID=520 RepID=UPI000B94CEAC|nr:hypothetical protein [Bordetella pertussis]SNW24756.1 Uncharacterised protein [Bordetella pertussis]